MVVEVEGSVLSLRHDFLKREEIGLAWRTPENYVAQPPAWQILLSDLQSCRIVELLMGSKLLLNSLQRYHVQLSKLLKPRHVQCLPQHFTMETVTTAKIPEIKSIPSAQILSIDTRLSKDISSSSSSSD